MTAPELVAKVKNLPPVSQAAITLVGLLDQSAVSNDDVVQVLRCDNVLTAKLLRACNSPYFALAEPVMSVDQAVLLLGHEQILHIVLTLAFGGALSVPLTGYAVEANELWQHSLITASAAEVLANEISDLNIDPQVAFTAGLLHDMGKLVMNHVLTSDVQTTLRARIASGHLSRSEAERELIGTDHAEVGAHLLRTWRVPEEIVEAVANHHTPVLDPKPRFSVTTHLANCLAHTIGSAPGWDGFATRVDQRVAERLDINSEKLDLLVIHVSDAFERVERLMAMQ